jgi:peptidoglycan hydrolase-like protein with peptidoglycan-binding domain
VDHQPIRAHRRALVLILAVAAAAAVLLGAATGARAATKDDPGGVSSGSSSSGTSTSGSSNSSGTTGTSDTSGQDPAPNTQGATRTLRRGMSGPDVRTLQQALKTLGFRVTADGEYGTKTVRGVKRYERKNSLPADGVVDPPEAAQIAKDAGADTAAQGTSTPTDTSTAAPAGPKATLNADGTATAPAGAPPQVQQIIQAGNAIASKPYSYGGGHTDDFQDSGYDCSGSVSYALHGANLLKAPLDSGEFMSWGDDGPGQWVTIYANEDHMYMIVAGLRFDTSGAEDSGSRWQADKRSSSGYTVRHPPGL